MNRTTFFAELRSSLFKGSLGQPQVNGIEALLDAAEGLPTHHVANILANVHRETGGHMSPIKETVMPYHKDKNPSDAEVIRRLNNAYATGKLPWVKSPYWRTGAFGRGQIQITHDSNYRRFGLSSYDGALIPSVSARIAVVGMRDGMFTGKKLSDYTFPAALDNPPKQNPRRIVNGVDGSDKEVAGYHRAYHRALELAGWGTAKSVAPSFLDTITAFFKRLFGG